MERASLLRDTSIGAFSYFSLKSANWPARRGFIGPCLPRKSSAKVYVDENSILCTSLCSNANFPNKVGCRSFVDTIHEDKNRPLFWSMEWAIVLRIRYSIGFYIVVLVVFSKTIPWDIFAIFFTNNILSYPITKHFCSTLYVCTICTSITSYLNSELASVTSPLLV